MTYEYLYLWHTVSKDAITRLLNQHGDDGWRVHTALPDGSFLLERGPRSQAVRDRAQRMIDAGQL